MADFLELLNGVVDTAKEKITELAKEEIENKEKKIKLDEVITAFVENMLTKVKLNFFVKLCIKKLVLPHISEITQVIYDLLKAKITGETEEKTDASANVSTDTNKGETEEKTDASANVSTDTNKGKTEEKADASANVSTDTNKGKTKTTKANEANK